MKTLQTTLQSILSIGLAFVLSASIAEATPQRWKIGIIAPLSGEIAEWGLDTRRAIELANEMLGNDQFELIFEDDRCLGKAAVDSAHKLIDIDNINFGMLVCSESTISAAPLFEKSKVLVVAPAATADIISNAGEYIFRTWPSDRGMANAIIGEIQGKQTQLAIISENRGFPQEFAQSLTAASQQTNIKIAAADFDSHTSDFRSILLRLQRQSPNTLLINTDSGSNAVQIVKQLANIGWKPQLYGQYVLGLSSFYESTKPLSEGVIFSDAPNVGCDSRKLAGCDVYAEFVKRYGIPTSSPYMVASSIASYLAIIAAARSGEAAPDYLYRNTIETPIGLIKFDRNGDVVGPVHSLKIMKNGKPEILVRGTSKF